MGQGRRIRNWIFLLYGAVLFYVVLFAIIWNINGQQWLAQWPLSFQVSTNKFLDFCAQMFAYISVFSKILRFVMDPVFVSFLMILAYRGVDSFAFFPCHMVEVAWIHSHVYSELKLKNIVKIQYDIIQSLHIKLTKIKSVCFYICVYIIWIHRYFNYLNKYITSNYTMTYGIIWFLQ